MNNLNRRKFLKALSLFSLSGLVSFAKKSFAQYIPFAYMKKNTSYGTAETTQVVAKVLAVGSSYNAQTTQVVAKVLAVGGPYNAQTTQVVVKVLVKL